MYELAVERVDIRRTGAAKLHGGRRDGVEYRLHIRLRLADYTQDLARGGLLLQGLGEVAIAGFQLFEQPYILDGDDRLIGEGLKERDLLIIEGLGFVPAHGCRSDRLPRAQHGDRYLAPRAERLDHLTGQRRHCLLTFDVSDVERLPRQDDPPHDRVVRRGPR